MTKSIKEKKRLNDIRESLNDDVSLELLKIKYKFKFKQSFHYTKGNAIYSKDMVSQKGKNKHKNLFNKIVLNAVKTNINIEIKKIAPILKIFEYNVIVKYSITYQSINDIYENAFLYIYIELFNKKNKIGDIIFNNWSLCNNPHRGSLEDSLKTIVNGIKIIEPKIILLNFDLLPIHLGLNDINTCFKVKNIMTFIKPLDKNSIYNNIPTNFYNVFSDKYIQLFLLKCENFSIRFELIKKNINAVLYFEESQGFSVEWNIDNIFKLSIISFFIFLQEKNLLGFDLEDKITEHNIEEVKNLFALHNY